jgi:RNA polymerase sigma factor (sigma-70 family)
LGEKQRLPFRSLLQRAEAADLECGSGKASLVYEVVLAQALEFSERKAGELFEVQYMPGVRTVAHRAIGRRGLELVENFGGTLIIPGNDGKPKIAKYYGRTHLNSWLRSVVTNHCITEVRQKKLEALKENGDETETETGGSTLDQADCKKMLRPLFKTALESISNEDCVIFSMIFLDGVDQRKVAEIFGIHSGNITRRRQAATEKIIQRLQAMAQQRQQESRFESCMESVLAGEDPVLRDWLVTFLGGTVRKRAENQQFQGDN